MLEVHDSRPIVRFVFLEPTGRTCRHSRYIACGRMHREVESVRGNVRSSSRLVEEQNTYAFCRWVKLTVNELDDAEPKDVPLQQPDVREETLVQVSPAWEQGVRNKSTLNGDERTGRTSR